MAVLFKFVLSFVIFAWATLESSAKKQRCRSVAQCGAGQCCAFVPTKWWAECQASPAQGGDFCTAPDAPQSVNGIFIGPCPCSDGFECQRADGTTVSGSGVGRCVETAPTPCNTVKDCQADECCIDPNRPIGRKKRAVSIAGFVGECRKLGRNGDACFVSITTVGEKNFACPCAGGFQCQGNGVFDIPLGEMGTCAKPCTTNNDCNLSECCVNRTPLRGRKKRQVVPIDAPGDCQPLGTSGSTCYVNPIVSGGTVHAACPCGGLLQCQGSGNFEVPLGESGTCV